MELYLNNLLEDLKNYTPSGLREKKVQRIHRMCINFNHNKWAFAIVAKYPQFFREEKPKSDLAMAMGWALMAQKKHTQ